MTTPNPNDPAYPVATHEDSQNVHHLDPERTYQFSGLTKREAYIMAAMQGQCATGSIWTSLAKMAESSAEIADAHLAEAAKLSPLAETVPEISQPEKHPDCKCFIQPEPVSCPVHSVGGIQCRKCKRYGWLINEFTSPHNGLCANCQPEAQPPKVRTWEKVWADGKSWKWRKISNGPIEFYRSNGGWEVGGFAAVEELLEFDVVETTPPDPTPAAETVKPEPSDEAKKLVEEIWQLFLSHTYWGVVKKDAVSVITPILAERDDLRRRLDNSRQHTINRLNEMKSLAADRDATLKRAEEAEAKAADQLNQRNSLIDRLDTAEKSLAAMTAERDRLKTELAKAQALNRKSYAWCSDGRLHVFDPQRPPQCPANCGYAERPFAVDVELFALSSELKGLNVANAEANAELARMKPVVEAMMAFRENRIGISELYKVAETYLASKPKVQQ